MANNNRKILGLPLVPASGLTNDDVMLVVSDETTSQTNIGDFKSFIGATDTFTTGSTLVGNIVYFDNQDGLSAYTADLSALVTSLTLTGGNGITVTTGNTIDLGGALSSNVVFENRIMKLHNFSTR